MLSYWTSLIESFTKGGKIDNIDNICYQFYHRTASACFDSKKACVIYQLFYDNETEKSLDKYIVEIKKDIQIINPNENLSFYIWKVKIEQQIKETKPHGMETPFIILKSKDIYKIGDNTIEKIRI